MHIYYGIPNFLETHQLCIDGFDFIIYLLKLSVKLLLAWNRGKLLLSSPILVGVVGSPVGARLTRLLLGFNAVLCLAVLECGGHVSAKEHEE